MRVAVIGLWHQGVVGAACLAEMGHDVTGADTDAHTVARLAAGAAPLFEPGLDDLLAKQLSSGRLRFTADEAAAVRDADVVFIMFDTPVDEHDRSDLSGVFASVDRIAPALARGVTVLVTAQVPVGTCDALRATVEARVPDAGIAFAYMPENLRLGQAIERFMAPPLPVIGTDEPAAFERVLTVLGPLAAQWHHVSLRTGEMIKHALNAYLGVTITFANELGNICDAVGADGKRVGEVLRLEPRVGPKAMLLPGLGFSGGTLARDMQTLRGIGREHELPTLLLDGVWAANAEQNRMVVRKLGRALRALRGARVAVLGLTYKPDTSTLRRSAALEVIADLAAAGADVHAHDPRADRDELRALDGVTFHDDALDAVSRADAVVLMTPWASYRELDFGTVRARMAGTYVLDTAGLWDAAALSALGFAYDDIGRGRQARRAAASSGAP